MSVQHNIQDAARNERTAAFDGDVLHAWFEAQADRAPHHTAFEFDGETLSYRELDVRANQVANYLIGKGIAAGDFVGFHQAPCADLFIGILGAMKAGAAYLPIDAATPADRVEAIVAEFDPAVIFVSSDLVGTHENTARLIVIEDERDAFDSLPGQIHFAGSRTVDADTIAQVIFKTGPNGAEKGLAVPHSEAVLFMRSMVSVYGIEEDHRCCQDVGLALDVALEEVWAMLSAGATVVFAGQKTVAKTGFLADERISVLSTTPATLAAMNGDESVGIVIVGGARCDAGLAVTWALKARRLVSIKTDGDRVPSFAIEQDAGAWRPRMLYARACERAEA